MSLFTRFSQTITGVTLSLSLMAATPAATAADVLKLGYSGPLSGGGALFGQNHVMGLRMAVDELNNEGGVEIGGKTYKVELVAMDDKYSPAEAAINARRLQQQHKTAVIFAGHTGGTFSMQAFNQPNNFLTVSYTSVPSVLEQGNSLTVRTPPSFHNYLKPFTQLTMEQFGKKVALLPGTHDYAKIWSDAFVPAWEAAGGEVVADNPMDYNKDADFYSGVSRVLASKPDVLFIGGASEPTGLVAKQARELGFKGGFIVMDQAKLDEMARVAGGFELLEGAVGVMPILYDERPGSKIFVERFQKLHDTIPTSETAYNYFGAHVVIEAMKHAGTISDPQAIRASINDALKTLPEGRNPYGYTNVDATGGFGGTNAIAQVVDGKIVQKTIEEDQ